MRKLVYYELRKHFLAPVTAVVFLLLLVADGIKIYSVYQESSLFSSRNLEEFKGAYQELYPVYSGEITEEKINGLLEIYRPIYETVRSQTASTKKDESSYTYNVYSDELFFRKCFLEEMEYDYTYRPYAMGIVLEAKKNMDFYKGKGNMYEHRRNLCIARAFYGREIGGFYNTEMYQSLLYYDFSSLLLLMLMVYGCASVFAKEEETEMRSIIRTSRNGQGKTYLAKAFSVLLFSVVSGILFTLWDFCLFALFFGGTESAASPLYALRGFQDTLLNLSLGQGYLLISVFKIMGMCMFCVIFLLFSLVARKSLVAFLMNFASVIACLSVYDTIYNSSHLWNPVSLISGRNLILRSEFGNLAGYPVPRYMIVVGVAVACIFGGLCAGWILWHTVKLRGGKCVLRVRMFWDRLLRR